MCASVRSRLSFPFLCAFLIVLASATTNDIYHAFFRFSVSLHFKAIKLFSRCNSIFQLCKFFNMFIINIIDGKAQNKRHTCIAHTFVFNETATDLIGLSLVVIMYSCELFSCDISLRVYNVALWHQIPKRSLEIYAKSNRMVCCKWFSTSSKSNKENKQKKNMITPLRKKHE